MAVVILAINSGSSSLKFGLYRVPQKGNTDPELVLSGGADGIGHSNGQLRVKDSAGTTKLEEAYQLRTQGEALNKILGAITRFTGNNPDLIGHRIVHGGPKLRDHARITSDLLKELEASVHFAPLHIPPAVALIRETEKLLPDTAQYACFDTAFHRTMPDVSRRYALPERLYELGVERYGFHGLSYESIAHRLNPTPPARVVCAHLGSGASLAALRDGRSVDTSMGMTPTGGVPMATRTGDLDPGILLFLLRTQKSTADQLEKLLNRESGLGALSGGESDMRLLEQAAANGDAKAQLAIDVFAHAIRKQIGAYAAELGGLDLLVFTGGIGEHSASMRNRICTGLEFLGISSGNPEQCSKVRVMESQEELQIARIVLRISAQPAG
jgi:acetate kinase